jgi:putative hydrolase of HD superfamily
MHNENLSKQIAFIKEIDKLKYIQRKTKLFNSNRHENDAEHSWHLAMMVMVMAEHANAPIDMLKVLKMVLIHDIVEIDSGDVFFYDTTKKHSNTDEELLAANRIFGLLPEAQAQELIEIWKEFEAGETDDAKFAKSMDRLAPMMQNHSNNGGTWKEFNVPYQKVYNLKNYIQKGSITMWRYAESILNESLEKGYISKD